MTERVHGGNVYEMARRFNLAQEDIVDFSASVSPLGIPKKVMAAVQASLVMLTHYPDPDCIEFRQAVAQKHGVERANVLAANGAAEIIYLIARMVRPARTLIPYPTFIEYECAVRSVGGEIAGIAFQQQGSQFVIRRDEFLGSIPGSNLIFICNPNNPTGTIWRFNELMEIIEVGQAHDCLIVIDEAYLDLAENGDRHSLVGQIDNYYNLIVIKSLTKVYALPGLRIGYAVAPPHLIQALSVLRDPWSVNALAQAAGTAALQEVDYLVQLQGLVQRERQYLYEQLASIPGLTVYDPTANFILADAGIAGITTGELQQALARQGLFIRDCTGFNGLGRGFFRIAVRTRADNQRLIDAIGDYFAERL